MLPRVGRVDRITTVCRATTATSAAMSMCRACCVPCACELCVMSPVCCARSLSTAGSVSDATLPCSSLEFVSSDKVLICPTKSSRFKACAAKSSGTTTLNGGVVSVAGMRLNRFECFE